jgi:hypothetical protein
MYIQDGLKVNLLIIELANQCVDTEIVQGWATEHSIKYLPMCIMWAMTECSARNISVLIFFQILN